MRFALVGMMAAAAMVVATFNVQAQPGQPLGQSSQGALPEGLVRSGSVEGGAPAPNSVSDAPGMIAIAAPVDEKYQQITVVDTRDRVMATYHIELMTGTIELKSVRKIDFDLKMLQFNSKSPLPHEIRAKIEQLR